MERNYVNSEGIPMGFGMLLAQNQPAMERFASLSLGQKQSIINGARGIASKAEMRDYVNKISRQPLS